MSSVVETATGTIQERTSHASQDLCNALGLVGVSPTNMKYLTLALAEVATQELSRNPDFAALVRSRYEALVPVKPSRAGRSGTSGKLGAQMPWRAQLMAVGTVDESLLDPYAPPNPFTLRQLYGSEQLAAALTRYSLTALKESIGLMQERYPGTKPKKLTKAGIIDYIVEQVAGPGY